MAVGSQGGYLHDHSTSEAYAGGRVQHLRRRAAGAGAGAEGAGFRSRTAAGRAHRHSVRTDRDRLRGAGWSARPDRGRNPQGDRPGGLRTGRGGSHRRGDGQRHHGLRGGSVRHGAVARRRDPCRGRLEHHARMALRSAGASRNRHRTGHAAGRSGALSGHRDRVVVHLRPLGPGHLVRPARHDPDLRPRGAGAAGRLEEPHADRHLHADDGRHDRHHLSERRRPCHRRQDRLDRQDPAPDAARLLRPGLRDLLLDLRELAHRRQHDAPGHRQDADQQGEARLYRRIRRPRRSPQSRSSRHGSATSSG